MRYYFDVVDGDTVSKDCEGTELLSLMDARVEAILDARALMSAHVLLGKSSVHRAIRIVDGSGGLILNVPFSEAIL
jgi:hypothetical protein